ncbi:dienelactone hydrolase family protein [Pseudoxanthomonas suwonensis]|uniref:Phospholipase n=1 Tax=Pseudoxanthomonas suwonensis TaxID=314722 RepID=A0A0E3Z3G5_9GAMM|nr:dienelactone hydrolase family protein [Pseudoxanthomonas suwonensis]AKC88407.1 phospholipase [Pseudoxanthomonas suwonensis]
MRSKPVLLLASRCLAAVLLAVLVAACQPRTAPPPESARFVQRELAHDGRSYRYSVFVPAAAQPRPLPVVLFLHGSGERGSDGQAPTLAGLGPWLRANAAAFPALVVFPQVPEGEEWMGGNARMALAALEAASAEFGGDPARTYATGMSMGGYGTWEVALLAPQRFAALVPVCGGVRPPRPARPTLYVTAVAGEIDPYAALAARLEHVPAWMFHGARDDLVPAEEARRLHRAARAVGADFRYTEYPDGDHNAWDATYADPAMWDWLFAQRLP